MDALFNSKMKELYFEKSIYIMSTVLSKNSRCISFKKMFKNIDAFWIFSGDIALYRSPL